jgi:methyl-accepting chemotaxis protein
MSEPQTASGPRAVAELGSGAALHRRYQMLTAISSTLSLGLISGYLMALLSLTSGQWKSFFGFVGVMSPIFILCQWLLIDVRMWRPMKAYLDGRETGGVSESLRREAFAAAVHFPRYTFLWGHLWYWVGGVLLAGWLMWRSDVTGYTALVIGTAGFTGGFVGMLFHAFATKALLAPLREALAAELPDAELRQGLIRRLSLRTKLIVSVSSVTIVVVLFAIFLAQVRATRSIELFAVRFQSNLLARVAPDVEDSIDEIDLSDLPLPFEVRFALVDAAGERIVDGAPDALGATDLEAIRASVEPFGDSRRFDSATAFAWQRLWDDRVLVAYVPWNALAGASTETLWIFAALLVLSTGIALGLGLALSRDVAAGVEAVRAEVMRVADGDLSAGRVFESEDELGDLARGFQRMAGFLRATVGSVKDAADRVESAASEFAQVGDAVTEVSSEQRSGVRQASEAMANIRREVQGIAESAQSLNTFMEESSSSVAELGAVGEELSQNAGVLSSKVDESSSSVEQMIRSVSEVARNTEDLHEAAGETSSSMEQMAVSMREVEGNASETARLSSQMVQVADVGRDKVRQTIDGMSAIREATETAQEVITKLGRRVTEIGAVVEVIDDVADETNLLALNAAIIAAQAGEHGRSFSVVADEIKELADRVLASTKEIDAQIRSVQQESANAIGAITRGSESVQSGVDLSAEAGVALEQITEAARGAGERISEIVSAVQEQTKASSHVVELMDRVRAGVEQIRAAGAEQERSNQVVLESCTTMRDVAEQVRSTTDEQSRGSRRIGQSVESVREAVDQINRSLQQQSSECGQAVEFLTRVNEKTATNQQSTERMREAMRGLVRQAEALRESVQRFRL